MKKENDNLIAVRIAARRYGLPVKWLREQALLKNIPALVAEKSVLFDADVLANWLSQRAQKGASNVH